jgi:enoyl-CoA hydratase/carnithine racemase
MTTPHETLLTATPAEGVLLVTLNRPDAGNSLSTQMAEELLALLTDLTADPGAIRALVLTGAGNKIFCAGADLKERDGMTDAQWVAQHRLFEAMRDALVALPVPVICAVNGAAYGGGAEIALNCDFIYAADGARLALPEVKLGIMPGLGGAPNLVRAAGERRAREPRAWPGAWSTASAPPTNWSPPPSRPPAGSPPTPRCRCATSAAWSATPPS